MIEVIGGYIGAGVFCIGMLWIWYAIVAHGLSLYIGSVTDGNVRCNFPSTTAIEDNPDIGWFAVSSTVLLVLQALLFALFMRISCGFCKLTLGSLTDIAQMALSGAYIAGTYLAVPVIIGLILYFSHKGLKIGYRTWLKVDKALNKD